ncbi:MAG: S-layer homology domain-containing protein [Oscillospiraceae bacterium]|nr:S-layer homology domain-containing protein [Oscillospiraceae bacterium]
MKKIISLLISLSLLLSIGLCALAAGESEKFDPVRPAYAGVTVLEDGSVLATDSWNKVIWKISGGKAEIFAGKIPVADLTGEPQGRYNDGKSEDAFFMSPCAIVPFLDGFAVSDPAANVIRYVTETKVMTLSGSGTAGLRNGKAQNARFNNPTGLAADDKGGLYIADTGNNCVRYMSSTGSVRILITNLSAPTGLAYHGGKLYIVESGKNRVLTAVGSSYEVLCGSFSYAEDADEYYGGFSNGKAARARFDHPSSVAVSEDGRVFISDPVNHAIRYLKDGRVYTLKKGDGIVARPVEPNGIFISGNYLYAADGAGDILKYSIKEKVFSDVAETAWYAEGTAESVRLGLITGTGKTTFSPEVPTTRAMFVTMLARFQSSLDGTTRIDGDSTFKDMTEETWWSASARWAADAGIVKGMPDGTFAPDKPITREQMATMLYRYAEYLGLATGLSADLSSFPDSGEVRSWALEGMEYAVGSGLIEGSDGSLLPAKDATRAQAVTVFLRLLPAAEG